MPLIGIRKFKYTTKHKLKKYNAKNDVSEVTANYPIVYFTSGQKCSANIRDVKQ